MKVAISGAASGVGRAIAEAILRDGKHTLLILSRSESGNIPALLQLGASIATVDYGSHESLTGALIGVHTVISAIGDHSRSAAAQLALVHAAIAAGVSRFVPSGWSGTDGGANDIIELYRAKQPILEALRAQTQMKWSHPEIGIFMNYLATPKVGGLGPLKPLKFFVDIENCTAVIPGDGELKLVYTTVEDVGAFVAKALDAQEDWPESLRIVGSAVTHNELLAARLNINHTQLNVIGLAANIGVYSSGPFWGRIVDTRGPRIPIALAFFFLFGGYTGIRHFYDAGVPAGTTISTFGLGLLIACSFMTGAGGNAAFTGAVNSTAKTFPDRARATTTGIVLSGFGLSAFFFSTLAHFFFPGDTSSFLLVLSAGTAFTTIVGFFFVRAIPLAAADMEHMVVAVAGTAEAEATIFNHPDESHTPLLDETRTPDGDDQSHSRSRSRSIKADAIDGANIYGKALWVNPDFWLLFLNLSLLSGTGLMYINNVGSMSQALYAKANPTYDDVEASKWQAAQVSTISVMNFSGRILIGLLSDTIKNRFGLPRSYSLLVVSTLFFLSQLLAMQISAVEDLWKASVLVGLSYGTIFGLFPTVCIEFFGLAHFSENWGYLSLSPLAGGNLFSIAFGRNLDAHEPGETTTARSVWARAPGPVATRQCLEGRGCYVDTLMLTAAACFLAILVSAFTAWRERRKLQLVGASGRSRVIWEDAEAA
ncbi:NmrA domain-containing protein [Mycena chlorophos]|uniref:NmrA domain-containing protein n=1 Tax=Mycena chlorophos TaxID=658473 RepID=A0A8H6TNT0_MYCCL|nr:NmrA domain-containing protein [Mycena chlorophos]